MAALCTVLAVLLGCSCLLAVLALFVSWWLEEQYGPIAGKILLSYAMVRMAVLALFVGVLLVVFILAIPPACWRLLTIFVALLGLVGLWGLAVLWHRDRDQAGEILLTLSPVDQMNRKVVMAVGGLGGGLLLVSLFDQDMVWMFYGLYILSLGVGQFYHDCARLSITRRGIFAPEGSVRWEHIRSIEWLDGTNKVSALLIRTDRWVFHTQVVRIAWTRLEEVDEIIGEFAPEGTWSGCELPVRTHLADLPEQDPSSNR